jgi:thiol-disulfide isomerase/thioredoxin
MNQSSARPSRACRLPRLLTALALALAFGQLSLIPAALALSLQEPAPPAAPAASPEVKRALDEGFQELKRRASRPAISAFRRADKLARGHSTAALVGLAHAYFDLGDSARAIEYSRKALPAAALEAAPETSPGASAAGGARPWRNADATRLADPDQRELLVTATNLLGLSLTRRSAGSGSAEAPSAAALGEAARAFRYGVALSGGQSASSYLNLGRTLLQLGRDEEGVAALRESLAQRPEGEAAQQAKLWIDDPRRARGRYAPPFSLETLDGDRISLADLHGKITLLDFWATWCAPCVASVPSLKKIAAQMAEEPFSLISVSGDRNGAQVRDFVASHGVTWPQCWDGNGSVQGQFRVRGLPTFLLLDSDGRILFSKTGWGSRAEGELLSEIRKAVQTLKAAAGKSAS